MVHEYEGHDGKVYFFLKELGDIDRALNGLKLTKIYSYEAFKRHIEMLQRNMKVISE